MSTSIKNMTALFLLIFIATLHGQEENEKTITYKAPSNNFIDITIQSHKGLPRFGDIFYHRGVTPPTNKDAYASLVEMRFLKEVFADMDLEKLTKLSRGGTVPDQKIKNSQYAQSHLLKTIRLLCSEDVLKKHFCDTEVSTRCTFENAYGDRTGPRFWGGSRNNEFQQLRSYKAFVKDYLDELKNWSNTFFKSDQQIGYYVAASAIIGAYDFKKKGFWISSMGPGSGFILHGSSFLAYTENEKKLKNGSQKIFWAVEAARAKEMQLQNRAPIFMVFKVKVLPKIRNITHVEFSFELEDQLVELYRRPDLRDKIGEIDINNLITAY